MNSVSDRPKDSRSIDRQQRQFQRDEFRSAVRALLMTPLMSQMHEDFVAVRRQADALHEWFARETGWPLQIGREGARLYKRPTDLASPTRGLPEYGRRRYVLLCLACAVLERAEPQVTLRLLGERLLGLAAEPALSSVGFTFTLGAHHERRELVAVCRTLLNLGVLQRVAGDVPADGITRSQLAAEVLGDAHALDSGHETATLALAVRRQAIPLAYDQDDDILTESTNDGDIEPRSSAERDRDIWAKAGVLVNELARPALFLNLPTSEAKSYGRPPGEPAYASLRLLLRSPPPWDVADRKIYVCENPNLLAIAADHWGPDCAPLVCTDGMPAAAQRCLLSQLATARARLCYHGDFDWPGIRIGNHVMREHGAQPWRFGTSDYEAAAQNAPALGQPLIGKMVDASWDTALSPVTQQCCIAIPEEGVAASLLQDLTSR